MLLKESMHHVTVTSKNEPRSYSSRRQGRNKQQLKINLPCRSWSTTAVMLLLVERRLVSYIMLLLLALISIVKFDMIDDFRVKIEKTVAIEEEVIGDTGSGQ